MHHSDSLFDTQLVAKLADEMISRWQAGEHVLAEELLHRHPQLWHDPELAVELVYEEICLREEHGQRQKQTEVLQRFPQWRQRLQVMLECHRLLDVQQLERLVPGEQVAGYRLLKALGCGASGQVFLAQQSELADRLAVLKITSLQGHEHLNLARLQHTHIVPLYAVHDDRDRNLRILCMPYLGGETLEHALHDMANCPLHQRSGERLMASLHKSGVRPTGPAAPVLHRLSYVQAMCWIAACLAEALHYAHQCGMVHLDVKPSNILIAADGQPMLLDFHLARAAMRGGEQPDSVGGTPPYMAPEQRAAADLFGEPLQRAIGPQADVFALGAVLYESLGGTLAACAGASPPLCRLNSQVSRGLSDIVAKCLAESADDRYADASALATDLRCHLGDRPLQGTANRSWLERYRKWRRRTPAAVQQLAFRAAILGALAIAAFGACEYFMRRDAVRRPAVEAVTLREQTLLDLHNAAEQVRGILDFAELSRDELRGLRQVCREFWDKRELLRDWLKSSPSTEATADLLELMVLATELHVRQADGQTLQSARRQAIDDLNEAGRLFGGSAVLDQHRERHRLASSAEEHGRSRQPQTAWEYVVLGRTALQENSLGVASALLRKAADLQPHGFWPNFYYGHCAYRLGSHAEAVTAFSVCIGAHPRSVTAYLHRALAYAKLDRPELAERDYEHVLRLDPASVSAFLNRASLRLQTKQVTGAETDLKAALRLGADKTQTTYRLAEVHAAQGNIPVARQCLEQVLSMSPFHQEALALRQHLSENR